MPPLTAERNTPARSGNRLNLGLAAAVLIFAGALVARDAAGNAIPGATAVGILGAGRACDTVDNTLGLAGAETVEIEKGIFRFDNLAADLVTIAMVGADCFIVDDQTVAATNGGATRSVAGRVFDVDAQGVWVVFE
jgi:hypothetical protein